MKKKLPAILALSATVAAVGYKVLKGHNILNRVKFNEEHKAVTRYIEANHPGATYTEIKDTGENFFTIIKDEEKKYLLTVTKTQDGTYVYTEEEMDFTF